MNNQYPNGFVTLPIEIYNDMKVALQKAEDELKQVVTVKRKNYGDREYYLSLNDELIYKLATGQLLSDPAYDPNAYSLCTVDDMWFGSNNLAVPIVVVTETTDEPF